MLGHVVITEDFELHDDHLDHDAEFKCGGTSHKMADQFSGLWKCLLVNWKRKFTRLTDHAKSAHRQLAVPATVPESSPIEQELQKDIAEATTQRKSTGNEDARRKLQEREAKKKMLRRSTALDLAGSPESEASPSSCSSPESKSCADLVLGDDAFADNLHTPPRAGWTLVEGDAGAWE